MIIMKNKAREPRHLLADYYERGWVDLDGIMEAISKGSLERSDAGESPAESISQPCEERKKQILAWMELTGASSEAVDAMRKGWYTEEQLAALHEIWSREMERTRENLLSVSHMATRRKKWRDFSAFRNGVKARHARQAPLGCSPN
jgi:hypothetical protein